MRQLSQEKVNQILKEYKPTFPKTYLCKDIDHVKKLDNLDYPVILKVDSPDIIHKSDEGMVVLDIKSKEQLLQEAQSIKHNLDKKGANLDNFIIQDQIKGKEIIVGMKRDPTFGPAILFGLGGIFVEVLKDVSFEIAPLTEIEAEKMIKGIKTYPILKGIRGEKPVNLVAIKKTILMISDISLKHEDIMEIDLNPVIVNEKDAYVVDARFLIGDNNES